jgi:cell pole-organizing protein PopZ
MRQDGEPSVEEILASIKKVIARDNRESAEEERHRRERASRAGGAESDEVLELGAEAELIDDDGELEATEAAPLVDVAAREAMRESFAALALLAEPGAQPQIVRSGETSLEGLVREMLRPMLAEWLERNLPAMVERLVAAEIARIAGKKG